MSETPSTITSTIDALAATGEAVPSIEPVTYSITFERIGRRTDPSPLTVEVPANTEWPADYIAERVHRYAARMLASRHFEVTVDLDEGRGSIFTGQPAGSFTLAVRDALPEAGA